MPDISKIKNLFIVKAGRKNQFDNAIVKSLYKIIKRELIQDVDHESPEQAQKEIFKYIELYYNTKRMNSLFEYVSPSMLEELNS